MTIAACNFTATTSTAHDHFITSDPGQRDALEKLGYSAEDKPSPEPCYECHGDPGYRTPEGENSPAGQICPTCNGAGSYTLRWDLPLHKSLKPVPTWRFTNVKHEDLLTIAPEFRAIYDLADKLAKRKSEKSPWRRNFFGGIYNFASYGHHDNGNGELFANVYGNDLKYDWSLKKWLLWDGKRWRHDEDGQLLRLWKKINQARRRAARKIQDADHAEAEKNWTRTCGDIPRQKRALEAAQKEKPIADTGKGWNANKMLLGVENGVVDLADGSFRVGRRDDKITVYAAAPYDPQAKAPRWERFIAEVCADDAQKMKYLQKAIGYSATGSVKEQRLFCCHGPGGTGKSVLLGTIGDLLGDYSHTLPFASFIKKPFENEARYDLVQLSQGKRFCNAAESKKGKQKLDEGVIKRLTGGDKVSARYLYKDFVDFRHVCKFWLAFNDKPNTDDISDAMRDRVDIIPFNVKFRGTERDDKDLFDKLKAEYPGILNWIIEGAGMWQREGLGRPPGVVAANAEYWGEQDPVPGFADECADLVPGGWESNSTLWKAYQDWSADHPDWNHPFSEDAFGRRLGQMEGITSTKKNGQRGKLGIRLKGKVKGARGLSMRRGDLPDSD